MNHVILHLSAKFLPPFGNDHVNFVDSRRARVQYDVSVLIRITWARVTRRALTTCMRHALCIHTSLCNIQYSARRYIVAAYRLGITIAISTHCVFGCRKKTTHSRIAIQHARLGVGTQWRRHLLLLSLSTLLLTSTTPVETSVRYASYSVKAGMRAHKKVDRCHHPLLHKSTPGYARSSRVL